jgi:peptide/nickel transport system substrate-binding protein
VFLKKMGLFVLAFCVCFTFLSRGYSATAAQYKREIIVARPEDSHNLDPVTQDGNVNIWMFDLVMEGLLHTTNDGSGIEPLLAESYKVSDDLLTYTFKLKNGLTFSNGDPVLAEDVVWTYERAMTDEKSVWIDLVTNLKSLEAPDDSTVIVHLKEPSPVSGATFTLFSLLIGDKSYFEEVGLENYSKKPMGTGAYKIDEWQLGDYLRLVKNEKYRDAANVKTEVITFNAVPDDSTRVMQLQSGEADIITFVPWNRLAEIEGEPSLKIVTSKSTEIVNLVLSCIEGPTKDVRVRKAIAMAINKDAIVKMILFGYGVPATSFIPPSVTYHSEPKTYGYDVQAAKALLAEAGYPDGFPMTLTTIAGDAVYEQMATIVKEQLAAVGIDLKIELLEGTTFRSLRNNLKLQCIFGKWTSDIPDPSQQTTYWCDPSMTNCLNTGWVNERATELSKITAVEMDPSKRALLYAELQQIYADEVPTIPLYYAPYSVGMSANVSGFAQTPLGNYRFGDLAYIE